MSLVEHQSSAAAPIRTAVSKVKSVSRKARYAAKLLLTGECTTIKAAAERAGLSREHLSAVLHSDAGQAFIAHETRKTLTQGQMRASARLVELLDASSEHVSLDASKHVLGIAGISPPERAGVVINNNVAPGYVINLGDSAAERPSAVIEAQAIDIAGDDVDQPQATHGATHDQGGGS